MAKVCGEGFVKTESVAATVVMAELSDAEGRSFRVILPPGPVPTIFERSILRSSAIFFLPMAMPLFFWRWIHYLKV